MLKRIINILLALVFIAFAVVNLNDPDPLPWVMAYGSVALLFALAVFGRADRRVSGWLCVALTAWMLTMLPGIIDWLDSDMPSIVEEMKASTPHVEVVREFLGLMIAVWALIFLTFSTPKVARLG
ncbi:MAG: transmembrane 220 family protein [Flavobacteriales bacterium]|nr:transmembrane 220 family protein [Flavobacteriales bacterium]HRH68323.1 transmembrane 220 family protein [Flavobacteriales bacterium]